MIIADELNYYMMICITITTFVNKSLSLSCCVYCVD